MGRGNCDEVSQGGGELSQCLLYLDEDSQGHDFLAALRSVGVDVVSSTDSGMDGQADSEQLLFATSLGRVLYSRNIRDFRRLHIEYAGAGIAHAGLIFGISGLSPGERTRRVLRILERFSAAQLADSEQFLSHWGEDRPQ